ncbi:hypothetical protein [uncultured Pseudophaeobacter sp.]|uniref:hypothetical protein n=1 Tax=uncultured Pseudophaeobacter sp. TaxID=1759421 RepID=UPI0025E142E7|nr:hypothetical protein [uncultured Pseudophaeobacter sp.]
MMKITCLCIAGLPGQLETIASVSGDILTVDSVAFDLSSVPEGGFAEPEGDHPFAGRIERTGGVLHLALRWHYDAATAEPIQPATAPVLTVTSGPVPDPVTRLPQSPTVDED